MASSSTTTSSSSTTSLWGAGWSEQFSSPIGLGRTALAAFCLGNVFALSLVLQAGAIWYESLTFWRYGMYWASLATFHMSEFISTAAFKPGVVNYDSFLINHSTAYTIAFIASQVEFWIEYGTTSWKSSSYGISAAIGLVLVNVGMAFRIGAMWTAQSNFSHLIEVSKRKEHVLVTHGVYRYVRHPSYLGWFIYSVGTQIVLANPICAVTYAIVSYDFFKTRIAYEESILMEFFPTEYPVYKTRTISGVPGVFTTT